MVETAMALVSLRLTVYQAVPWPIMNECRTLTFDLQSIVHEFADKVKEMYENT
jgi:hypothetical protein